MAITTPKTLPPLDLYESVHVVVDSMRVKSKAVAFFANMVTILIAFRGVYSETLWFLNCVRKNNIHSNICQFHAQEGGFFDPPQKLLLKEGEKVLI